MRDTLIVINEYTFTMEIIFYTLIFLGGIFSLYFTGYAKAKSNNKALLEDIAKLEDEKQKVIAKYQSRIEEIRKNHTLDIEKRKFQYQDKRTQFSKYFSLLDEFNGKCNSASSEKFLPVITDFMNGYLVPDTEKQHQATLKYNQDIQELFFELNAEHLKMITETNSIRLIATPEVDALLDILEAHVKLATDQATDMLKFMATPEFWLNQHLVAPYQMKLEESGKSVLEFRFKLREQMKAELNEI